MTSLVVEKLSIPFGPIIVVFSQTGKPFFARPMVFVS